MQRFCLTLTLLPDPALQQEYVERHRAVWPDVLSSLRQAGVLDMHIYLDQGKLIMTMDTTDDFTFERKAEMDRANPVVMQWEGEMAKYQGGSFGEDASQRWRRVEPIFDLRAQLAAHLGGQ